MFDHHSAVSTPVSLLNSHLIDDFSLNQTSSPVKLHFQISPPKKTVKYLSSQHVKRINIFLVPFVLTIVVMHFIHIDFSFIIRLSTVFDWSTDNPIKNQVAR